MSPGSVPAKRLSLHFTFGCRQSGTIPASLLHVTSRLCGATISASASAVTRVASNLYFTMIAPLLTVRCDCTLWSFEVAGLLLLLGAEDVVNLGLHSGVRDDQPCPQ